MTGEPVNGTRTKPTAIAIAKALLKIGYDARAADHQLAVKVFDVGGNQVAVVWLPVGEPTPTGLGDKYLWGPTGDEHQAEDYTGVQELVQAIARTLQ